MTDLIDAARQALNSLRGYRREIGCKQPCDAERALEAALEQTEQEPVAFAYYWPPTNTLRRNPAYQLAWGPKTVWKAEVPLFTHPPRREWRGLTEEEIQSIHDTYHKRMGPQEFARAVEAVLKEKNND